MKKFLFLAVLFAAFSVNAQTLSFKSTTTSKTKDTVANTGTRIQRLQIKGDNTILTIQPTFTKISGTAGGTATLQGSVDGVGYSNIGSAYTVTDTATQTTMWSVNPSIYQYYQLKYVGSGTMSVSFVTTALARPAK